MSTVLTLKIPKGVQVFRGRDRIWQVIMRLGRDGAEFTRPQIVAETNGHKKSVADYMARLVKAGFIEIARIVKVQGSRHRMDIYRLVKTARHAPRLLRDGSACSPTAQQAMWNILRGPQGRAGVDPRDLRELTHLIGVMVTEETARTFLKRLNAVGYLREVRASSNRDGIAAYRLLPSHDTGPQPPMILRTKLVFDPNTREIVGKPQAREVVG